MLYFIVNEKSKSGNGNSVWNQIMKYLESKQLAYEYWMTKYQGHAREIAGEISLIDEGEKKLIIVGGDGTINEVLNGITDFERVILGVIPNGSGNDFVRGLKSERNPAKFLEKMQKQTCYEPIDIGQVIWQDVNDAIKDGQQSRLFCISAGIGMDALVCKLTMTSKIKPFLNKLKLGKLTYLLLTIKSLFTMKTANGIMRIDGKEKKLDKVIFSAAMNFRAEGGGVPMAPSADAKDGLLSMCCASNISRWKTFFYLPFLVMAKHGGLKGITLKDGREINWKLDCPMSLHTDGEYCGEVTEVQFRCLKGKLKVLL